MKNKKVIIIILLIIIVLITVLILIVKNKELAQTFSNLVKHEVAEDLYDAIAVNECSVINDGNVDKLEDKSLLDLIFGQMNKDNLLKDKISLKDYQTSTKKILGDVKAPNVQNYVYNGYIYNLDNDVITREKYSCENKYVSKLYGYTNDNNKLELNVKIAYIKDNNVYNLDNNDIGEYNKDNLNNILDNGTLKTYNYKKINDKYVLESIKS